MHQGIAPFVLLSLSFPAALTYFDNLLSWSLTPHWQKLSGSRLLCLSMTVVLEWDGYLCSPFLPFWLWRQVPSHSRTLSWKIANSQSVISPTGSVRHHAMWNRLFGTLLGYNGTNQMLRPASLTHSFMHPIWLPWTGC